MKVTVESESVMCTYTVTIESNDTTINQARMMAVATTALETLTNPNGFVVQRAVG